MLAPGLACDPAVSITRFNGYVNYSSKQIGQSQLENAITILAADEAGDGKSAGKRILEPAAIFRLHRSCAFPVLIADLPCINLGWHCNPLFDSFLYGQVVPVPVQDRIDAR